MDLHNIKEHLQKHLSDGLVVIVGSGLSCAEGLPGMGALADQLLKKVPDLINPDDHDLWLQIATLLDAGDDLETALLKITISEGLEKAIIDVAHNFIFSCEQKINSEVFNNKKILRFSKLLPHLLKPNSGIPVITTN